MLDRVELRGVRREKKQHTVSFPGKDMQFLFAVKRGIIHDNHSVLRQGREQALAEPPLKQAVVHCSVKDQRRYDFTPQFGRNNPDPFIPAAADCTNQPLSPWRPTILSV